MLTAISVAACQSAARSLASRVERVSVSLWSGLALLLSSGFQEVDQTPHFLGDLL